MLSIGVLCSGGLGLDTLSKISKEQAIKFVLTDGNSKAIIDFAIDNNIPYFSGNPRKGKGYRFIKNFNTDVIASINYLFLIEEDIIGYSNIITFNIHGSLLPQYRGRTPHVWAIINGELKTGITAHLIDSGCDTGKIIEQIEVIIGPEDTGAMILEKYASEYYPLVKKVLNDISCNQLNLTVQDENKATYFGKRTPEDGGINWNWKKEEIRNWVRAQANPYPGAFTFFMGKKVIIDKVSISEVKTTSDQTNGEIIVDRPNFVVKVQDGALNLDLVRTENSAFSKGNIFYNEDRK